MIPPSHESLATIAFLGIGAALTAAALTPLVRILAVRLGAIDYPANRRVNITAIPRMGGLAIVVSFSAFLLLGLGQNVVALDSTRSLRLYAFLAGGTLIAVAGATDDLKGIRPKTKLTAQFLAANVAWFGGAQVQSTVELPWIGALDLGVFFSYVATVTWILAITNAVNLIDGLDGLAGGLVLFSALTNLAVAVLTSNDIGILVNTCIAGAVLGFLFFNFNPARIFMGDTGSLFLGYILSAGALMSARQKESTLASLTVPIIALGIPLTDTLLAMLRRFLKKQSLFAPDRSHLHHLLLDLGLTHRRAVLLLYICTITLCVASITIAFGKNWQVGVAILAAAAVLVSIVRFAGALDPKIWRHRPAVETYGVSDRTRELVQRALVGLNPGFPFAKAEENLIPALLALKVRKALLTAQIGHPPVWEWSDKVDSRSDTRVLQKVHSVTREGPSTPSAILEVEVEDGWKAEIIIAQILADLMVASREGNNQ